MFPGKTDRSATYWTLCYEFFYFLLGNLDAYSVLRNGDKQQYRIIVVIAVLKRAKESILEITLRQTAIQFFYLYHKYLLFFALYCRILLLKNCNKEM